MVAPKDEAAAELLRRAGYTVMTKGWPDLLVIRTNRQDGHPIHTQSHWPESSSLFAVEIKRGKDRLRPEQQQMAGIFRDLLGVPFYVSNGKDFDSLSRKRGTKAVLPGHTHSIREIERKLRNMRWETERLERELAHATVLFEPWDAPPSISTMPVAPTT